MTPETPVTEESIEAAEVLTAKGEFAAALDSSQQMFARTDDGDFRMRLLFNIVSWQHA